MSFRVWENIHLISYCTALLLIAHGILIDPTLKYRPVDIFYAKKIVSELCGVVLIAAILFCVRYQIAFNDSIKKFHLLKIAKVIDQINQAKSFIFEIPEKLKEKFNYTSG